jgi:hypothetical protein
VNPAEIKNGTSAVTPSYSASSPSLDQQDESVIEVYKAEPFWRLGPWQGLPRQRGMSAAQTEKLILALGKKDLHTVGKLLKVVSVNARAANGQQH